MNSWICAFNFFLSGAALLLSVMGLWITVIIPGIDRWGRRFFVSTFIIFLLSSLFGILEMVFQSYIVPNGIFIILILVESLQLSLLPPMLTVYLLHCCGENLRRSRLLYAVLGMWAVSLVLSVSVPFIDGFIYITPENRYYRGPLYPLLIVPVAAVALLNLTGTIRRRDRLSGKAFAAFLIAMLPMAAALTVHTFIDVFPLVDISCILSAMAMYSFIISDQIEQDHRQQQEILRQQREIAHERASVMVLQMRPHFICNTLMSIHSLCRLDPLKAQQVTMDFTNYLRRNFNAVASDSTIPFSKELEHTRAYLAVEKAQYDDMLAVDYDTQFTHFRLPSLTLQPIVENAVKHGMNPYLGPLRISIRTRHTDAGAEIIVEDNGNGIDLSDASRPQIALKNIQQRLKIMCRGEMTISPRKGGGTEVKVTIP